MAIESLQGLWNTEGAEAVLDPTYGVGSGDLDSIWQVHAAEEREIESAMYRTASTSNDEISFDNDIDAELAAYRGPPRREAAFRVDRAYRAPRPVMSREEASQQVLPRQNNSVQSFRQQVLEREAQGLPAPVEQRPSALERAKEYANKPSAWNRLMDDDEG